MWNGCTCVGLQESDADGSSDEYSTASSGEGEGSGDVSEHLTSLVTTERGKNNICITHVLPWYWGCVGLCNHKEQPNSKCCTYHQDSAGTAGHSTTNYYVNDTRSY